VESYRRLSVWQKAMSLAEAVYRVTEGLPKSEMFGLTSQMRRAAVSVPSNIAEGKERGSDREFLRFLAISMGSLAELETQYLLSQRLGYLQGADVEALAPLMDETGKMLRSFKKRLEQKQGV
jgi:four helix bundle protein